MNKLFEYKLKDQLCDVNSQLTIKSILTNTNHNFVGYCAININTTKKYYLMKQIFNNKFNDIKEDRAIGALMGLACGDALGAPLEFKPLQYNKITLTNMTDALRFKLKAGQWTDDTSMALCLADSLLVKKKFDPVDQMLRYLNWWYNGYNNANSFNFNTTNHQSVGLGGNISLSFNNFIKYGHVYTKAGDINTSGNGSLMRLAPIAIACHNDINKGIKIARASSYVTHQGHEAAECCALLAYLLIYGINTGDKSVLNDLGDRFKSSLYSVNCLAASKAEKDVDRNWNWKDPNFKYSSKRSKKNPNYIGGYCMDALAMALHCFYTTNNYENCVLKAVNLGGDADTVGAISGQLAGAYYGVTSIPIKWINCVMKYDNGTIAYRASELYNIF